MLPGMVAERAPTRLHHRLGTGRRAGRRRVPERAPLRRPRPRARARAGASSLQGGFSFVLMDDAHLIGVRDPSRLLAARARTDPDGGWVLASETCALDIVGAHFVREVEPGEMVVIDASGGTREIAYAEAEPEALSVRVRLLRSSRHDRCTATTLHAARQRMGEELARQAPVDADMVMPVPESGDTRRAGIRARVGHPVRRRSGEEPLRRAHLHPAEARSSASRVSGSS